MLSVNQVCKSYGEQHVLHDVNLTVNKSQIVGLAGPSGSGKSTLLRCIQGLETIDSGTIECNETTGFMFQDFQLFPHMTVLNNLIYAPAIHRKDQNNREYAAKLLDKLGITEKADVYPCELSGGQKQRVALARSLMMHPALLLCDEPTSGLDIASTADVVTLLKSVRDMGITMIIASHDLDFITQVADVIVLLKTGRMVLEVDPQQTEDPIVLLKEYY